MSALEITRIGLPTGVTLTVQLGGPETNEAIIFLHGFPESHRTWRDVAPALAEDYSRVSDFSEDETAGMPWHGRFRQIRKLRISDAIIR